MNINWIDVMFINFIIISNIEKNREMLWQSLTWKPKLYIFNIISMENSTMKNMFVISGSGKRKELVLRSVSPKAPGRIYN